MVDKVQALLNPHALNGSQDSGQPWRLLKGDAQMTYPPFLLY